MSKKILQNDEIVEFFHRHVVPIYFHFQKGTEHKCFLTTTFVMSVYDQWFLVTAGHCIEHIENLEAQGYELKKCRLVDSMGTGATHFEPIPFDWDQSIPTKMCYDDTYDFGLIFPSDNCVAMLQTNYVVPMTEQVWEKQPDSPDFFFLLGVPDELSNSNQDIASITSTLHVVDELPERPAYFQPTDAPTFFGRIRLQG